jgi:hypothetical protein
MDKIYVVSYIGRCKTITVCGIQFNSIRKTVNVPEEQIKFFKNNSDFTVQEVLKKEIVKEEEKKEKKSKKKVQDENGSND